VNRLAVRYDPDLGEIESAISLRTRESLAPHFVRRILTTDHAGEVATTLDRSLQRLVEARLADGLASASRYGVKNAAALLLDFRSMEVLAQAGSADFFNADIAGQVDGTRSRRSPGSTLKPFIYALAMDQGLIHPQTMLADLPRRFSAYRPENFDGDFAGPLSATDALARSRNVPAVELSSRLTRPSLYDFLKRGGVALPREESYYGLSLPLGGGELTMEELVRLYAMLANGGRLRPIHRELDHPTATAGQRLLSPEASFLTLQMLGRVPRPVLDSPAGDEGIYWKTGTSMGFRDAWSVAVFDHYVLAVWVGNFDGERNAAFIGRTCAGPLLFRIIDAMKAEGRTAPRQLQPPEGANLRQVELCAVTGHLPNAQCPHRTTGWFIPGVSPIAACEVHREILIDTETGLRLSQDDGITTLRREVYEFWPTEFQALFESAGLPRRRPPPFAPGAGIETSGRSGHPPRIISPASGQTYARPSAEQPVMLSASTEAEVRKVYWFAGQAFLGAASPKEPLAWYPTPGEYRLIAMDDHGRATTARIVLEAASGGAN
jgi:penicillin-binding protein 1C